MAYKVLKEELDRTLKKDLLDWATIYNHNHDPFIDTSFNNYKEFLIKDYERRLNILKDTCNTSTTLDTKYYWIGINPYPLNMDVPMKELYDKLLKFIERTWCANVMFNIETHTKEGYRLHAHMLVKTRVKKFRIIDQLSRFFSCKENFIDVDHYSYGFNERVNYIKGIKTESKSHLVEEDTKQRDLEGLPQYFSNM